MIYEDKIKAIIGRPTINVRTSNSFPLVGEEVTLYTDTTYVESMDFNLKPSINTEDIHSVTNTSQHEQINFTPTEGGDLKQNIVVDNHAFTNEKDIYIYAESIKTEPFFNIEVADEIIRTDGSTSIVITGDVGYNLNDLSAIEVKVCREWEDLGLVTFTEFSVVNGKITLGPVQGLDRGIYDIESTLTNSIGVSFTKRINKLITVTPRLAVRPTQEQIQNEDYTEYVFDSRYGGKLKMYNTGVNDLYMEFLLIEGQSDNNSGFYDSIKLSNIPQGKDAYTLVLKKDLSYKDGKYYSRILLEGIHPHTKTNLNGTPQFSRDTPLVITIDQPDTLVLYGVFHSTLNFLNNVRNTVLDGRGYYNLSKGIHFTRFHKDVFWEDAIMVMNGTSDFEFFECEINNTGFVPIMAKTDPNSKNPWYWKGNFEFNNYHWHHCYMHDTGGEGCYIGYFTPEDKTSTYTGETTTFKNLKGKDVTYINGDTYKYQAHVMNNLRVYRNIWERTGYDGIQISNTINGEVAYNKVINAAQKNEKDQASGASIQSFDGKVYNNIVYGHNGPAYQLAQYIDGMEFFNNICYTDKATDAIQFIWSEKASVHTPDSTKINNHAIFNMHNNTLLAGRYTANGRNTVQVQNVIFKDNFLCNTTGMFANMTVDTMNHWKSLAKNNIEMTIAELETRNDELKFADIYNVDFRIATQSSLIEGGCGEEFLFDSRGYKLWSDQYPIGAYLGHAKKATIAITGVSITNKVVSILGQYQCEIEYTPSDTTQAVFVWSSSDDTIATVDYSGKIIVLKDGEVTITVTSKHNSVIFDSFTAVVEAVDAPIYMELSSDKGESVFENDVVTVTAITYPITAPQKVNWSITNGQVLENITDNTVSFTAALGECVLTAVNAYDPTITTSMTFNVIDISMIEFDEIKITIPTSENTGDLTIPDLMYDKKCAITVQMDDALMGQRCRAQQYVQGRWVDDDNFWRPDYDYLPKSTGEATGIKIEYSDGCGNNYLFPLDQAFMSPNLSKDPNGWDVVPAYPKAHPYSTTKELQYVLDMGGEINNHGAKDMGYDTYDKLKAQIDSGETYFTNNVDTKAFLIVRPGMSDMDVWNTPIEDSDFLYGYYSSKGTPTNVSSPQPQMFFKKDFSDLMGGRSLTDSTYEECAALCSIADSKIALGEKPFIYLGFHKYDWDDGVNMDVAGMKRLFGDVHSRYGTAGDDIGWFTTTSALYEYLFTKTFSKISKEVVGENTIYTIQKAKRSRFQLNEITLKTEKATAIETIAVTYNGEGVRFDTGVINNKGAIVIKNDNRLLDRANRHIDKYLVSRDLEHKEDALYIIGQCRKDLQEGLIDRLTAPVVVVLNSISINEGAALTESADIIIKFDTSIGYSKYRIGMQADLSDATWVEGSETEIGYTIPSPQDGVTYTLYGQVGIMDSVSEIKSDGIEFTIPKPQPIKIIFGRLNEDGSNGIASNAFVNGVNEVGYIGKGNTFEIKDILGKSKGEIEAIGIIEQLQSVYFKYISSTITSSEGLSVNQLKGFHFKGGSSGESSFKITVPEGRYNVKIFASVNYIRPVSAGSFYILNTGGDAITLTTPTIDNNADIWMQQEVTIGGDGLTVTLKIDNRSFIYIPINALILEPLD